MSNYSQRNKRDPDGMKGGSPFAELALLLSFVLVVYYAAHFTDTGSRHRATPPHSASVPEKAETPNVATENASITQDQKTEESEPQSPAADRPAPPTAETVESQDLSQPESTISGEISRPVAFLDPVDWESLSEEQISEINFIRQQFVTLVGGIDQDPTDPSYPERWASAQKLADEEFRSFFGEEAFGQLQLQAITSSE